MDSNSRDRECGFIALVITEGMHEECAEKKRTDS